MKSRDIEIKNPYASNDKYVVYSYGDKEKWKLERSKGLGGSDVASIVGMNPYRQSYELWEYKMRIKEQEDISDKSYVRYGTLAEEHLRNLFELDFEDIYKVFYEADTTLESVEYPFMRYSPDGLLYDIKNNKYGVWECKTSNIVQSYQREKWENNSIPQNYYCQILWGLIVTGFDFVVLKAQLKFENKDGLPTCSTRHYYFDANDEQVKQDMQYLKEESIKWWNEYIVGNKKPPLEIKL